MKSYFKEQPYRSKEYCAYVRTLPCIACGKSDTVAHHVRTAANSGVGIKPSDLWCLPICPACHQRLHLSGEKTFCRDYGIDIYRELFEMLRVWVEGKTP